MSTISSKSNEALPLDWQDKGFGIPQLKGKKNPNDLFSAAIQNANAIDGDRDHFISLGEIVSHSPLIQFDSRGQPVIMEGKINGPLQKVLEASFVQMEAQHTLDSLLDEKNLQILRNHPQRTGYLPLLPVIFLPRLYERIDNHDMEIEILRTIASIGDLSLIPFLRGVAEDPASFSPGSFNGEAALLILSRWGDPWVVDQVREKWQEGSFSLNAAFALGNLVYKNDEALKLLRQIGETNDPHHLQFTQYALQGILYSTDPVSFQNLLREKNTADQAREEMTLLIKDWEKTLPEAEWNRKALSFLNEYADKAEGRKQEVDWEVFAPFFEGHPPDAAVWLQRLQALSNKPLDKFNSNDHLRSELVLFVLSFTKAPEVEEPLQMFFGRMASLTGYRTPPQLSPLVWERLFDHYPEVIERALPQTHSHIQMGFLEAIDRLRDRQWAETVRRIHEGSDDDFIQAATVAVLANLETTKRYQLPLGMRRLQRDYSGKGVTVAMIDRGIHPSHDELKGKVTPALGFEATPPITYHHGTGAVSLIVGDHVGIAPDARIISFDTYREEDPTILKQLDQRNAFLRDVLERRKNDPTLKIVGSSVAPYWDSLSPLGRFYADSPQMREYKALLQELKKAGVIVLAAAGNTGNTSYNPEEGSLGFQGPFADQILLIGSSDIQGTLEFQGDDTVSDSSSRGGETKTLFLVAPGTHLLVARGNENELGFESGSSLSQLFVTGILCLMFEANPNLTADEATDILAVTAIPLLGYDPQDQGYGEINPAAAVVLSAYLADQKEGTRLAKRYGIKKELSAYFESSYEGLKPPSLGFLSSF